MLRTLRARSGWVDLAVIYLLAAMLVFPLFRLRYLNNWQSIESTFIADGRLFADHWPHHLWQPLWYCGTRSDYVYPPGLRYSVAILSAFAHVIPAQAYHIAIALFYALGIAAVYAWVRGVTGRRGTAWLAAAGVALTSPSFVFMRDIRMDSPYFVPWRLHVLMSYGEGPHISSLAVLPVVWLGAWRRFRGGGARWLLLSATAAATVVTINFYGATALAITFPILAWSFFVERRDWRVLRDAAAIAALAYAFTAFWLAPSYLTITARNLRLVAPVGNSWSLPAAAIFATAYLGLSRVRRFPAYTFFIWSGLAFLTLYIFGYRLFGFQIAGNSPRLIPEWDLFAILCLAQLCMAARGRYAQAAVLALLIICLRPSWRYVKHAYTEFAPDPHWQERPEYRVPQWLASNHPGERVFATGTFRFWYNAWYDGAQADGGSDQGILNPLLPASKWAIIHTDDAERLKAWLLTLGVDIVVVPGPSSKEAFKEFAHPALFDALFPLLYDDGAGNRFYHVQRRAPGVVRIVDGARLNSAPRIPPEPEKMHLQAYAAAVEAEPPGGPSLDRVRARRASDDEIGAEADIREGEALSIQETYDPYWRARADGKAVTVEADAAGFMKIALPPGKHLVQLTFETPAEIVAGRFLSACALVLAAALSLPARSEATPNTGAPDFRTGGGAPDRAGA